LSVHVQEKAFHHRSVVFAPDGRLNPTDYVKQFSGLARIRVTENREERKRALPLKCPSHDAAWAFIASMRLSGP
jgi:hypothetical protein